MKDIKNILRHFTFQQRIAAIIAVIAMIPAFLLGIAYVSVAQKQWTEEYLDIYNGEVLLLQERVSKIGSSLIEKMKYIKGNQDLRSSLSKVANGTLSEAIDYIYTLDGIVNLISVNDKDLSACFYLPGIEYGYGSHSYTLNTLKDEFESDGDVEKYTQISALRESESMWLIRNVARNGSDAGQRICLYSKIAQQHAGSGILELSIPVDSLIDNNILCADDACILIISLGQSEDQSYFSKEELKEGLRTSEILAQIWGDEKVIPPNYRLLCEKNNVAAVAYILPESFVKENVRPSVALVILIGLFFMVGVLTASIYTSKMLTGRIVFAIGEMKKEIETIIDQPDVLDDENEVDEVGQVTAHVKQLVKRTKNYILENERYKEQHTKLQMELLQMRFNPHFLYNTLASIRYQVHDKTIRKSIEHLIHYYRVVLSNGNLNISVAQELEMVRDYLEIEKFAYKLDGMDYQIEMQQEISECTLIKHILQPIVENSVKHGIRAKDGVGEIKIDAKKVGENLVFTVCDNGVGMSAEKARELLDGPTDASKPGGYGVYNVQQRIKTYYGNQYGLQIESQENIGTKVTVVIPDQLDGRDNPN